MHHYKPAFVHHYKPAFHSLLRMQPMPDFAFYVCESRLWKTVKDGKGGGRTVGEGVQARQAGSIYLFLSIYIYTYMFVYVYEYLDRWIDTWMDRTIERDR